MLNVAIFGVSGSGKTTAAEHLAAHWGFHRCLIAGPSKRAVGRLIQAWTGQPGDPLALAERWKNDGTAVRPVLQGLADVLAEVAEPDTIALDIISRQKMAKVPVVIDDARMPWECDAFRAAGWLTVKLVRPGHRNDTPAHPRTEGLVDHCDTHFTITNHGELADLYDGLNTLIGLYAPVSLVLTQALAGDPGYMGDHLRDLSVLRRPLRVVS